MALLHARHIVICAFGTTDAEWINCAQIVSFMVHAFEMALVHVNTTYSDLHVRRHRCGMIKFVRVCRSRLMHLKWRCCMRDIAICTFGATDAVWLTCVECCLLFAILKKIVLCEAWLFARSVPPMQGGRNFKKCIMTPTRLNIINTLRLRVLGLYHQCTKMW